MDQQNIELIEIIWKGPHNISSLKNDELKNEIGLYQIYGGHPISGSNTLLYIGQTTESFEIRFRFHETWMKEEIDEMKIYIGTIYKYQKYSSEELNRKISKAEQLLIYFCAPPYNSNHIVSYKGDENITGKHIIVLNYWKKNMLPYEVSTIWYHSECWKNN